MEKQIKRNIKELLKQKGSNTGKFCKRIGMSRNYINQISDTTKLNKLKEIADRLECSIIDLLKDI